MDTAGDHADPGHPSHTAACPPPRSRTSLRSDTAHATTPRHRTPTPDARQRTPGRSDARTGHWTPVRGQASVDTGRSHRTPDTGRGRGQGNEGTAGIRTSWATTPSDRTLARPTVFLWTAPAALDSPCRLGGEAAFQRELASRTTGSCLVVRRGRAAPRRTAVLGRFRVERRANGEASSVMARPSVADSSEGWRQPCGVGLALGPVGGLGGHASGRVFVSTGRASVTCRRPPVVSGNANALGRRG
jgi:hypothetical protein